MNRAVKYLILAVAFTFVASGVVVAAFVESYEQCGYRICWLLVPMASLFMLAAVVNNVYAVPRILMRQRYVAYGLYVIALSFVVSLIGLGLEYATRVWLDIPPRISYYLSPWILVDSFINSILLAMILLGIGALQLYERWSVELDREKRSVETLQAYISAVKTRLDSGRIMSMLDKVGEALKSAPASASSEIRHLADYLRHQLYELPTPPVDDGGEELESLSLSSLTDFLVSRHSRVWRHLIFQILLAVIAFGTFFNAPDQPEFTLHRLSGAVCMYLFLNLLAYSNILWLFRRFKKHRSLKRYCISVAVEIVVLVVPMIVTEILTYEPAPYNHAMPVPIMVVSTLGSMLTMALFIGGTGAIMFLQDWIIGSRRMTLLRTETVRQEYAFLRKQINPHFLFNVLNNVGILADEDPRQASEMLDQLKNLLQYQFSETDRGCATVAHEVWFLRTYLNLEKTRIEPFDYSISTDRRIGEMLVPTLIFITFVENAVKYSTVVGGRRYVDISFERAPHGMCLFRCVNSFSPAKDTADIHSGGLGLANTRRRLAFLYGERFSLSERKESDKYIVTLTIPTYIEDEVSYSR